MFELQSTQKPFVPIPNPSFVTARPPKTVRRSTSHPSLPSQIPKSSQIQAAGSVQTLTPSSSDSGPLPSQALFQSQKPNGGSSSPFSGI